MDKEIPPTIMLSFLYQKIKERNKGPILRKDLLKSIILQHFATNKDQSGGNQKGVHSMYIQDIINDLENFSLIKRINHFSYTINPPKIEHTVIRSIISKINELKEMDYEESKLKIINDKLDKLLEKYDKEINYKLLPSKCTKRLKSFPY